MNISTLIIEALRNLLSNKVRSLLTMLGIFIGVGAVIAMMSIGQGAKNSITDQMSSLGTQTLYLSAGNFTENVRNPQDLTNSDVEAIKTLGIADIVAPTVSQPFTLSQSNGNTVNASVTGVIPEYLEVSNYEIESGSYITQEQLDENSMVVVIGSEISDSLFSNSNISVVGETIRISGQPYTVIGVLKSKGSSTMGTSQDQVVFMPLSTAQNRLITRQRNTVGRISINVKDSIPLDQAQTMIENLMRERHGIFEGNPDDFTIMNTQEILDTLNSIMNTFVLFLGGVAGISLLVGGIGIMNIMLVTVTERTKEIGLRKALGAKKRDILAQFLVESSVLSLVGGILGILFGLGLAYLIAYIATMMGTELHASYNPLFILGSTLFSVAIGLFFGIYPANQAAKLQPVIALRTE